MSFGTLVFTPLVKKLQERYGSRRQYERMEKSGAPQDRLTEFEKDFLADRDSFYMATMGATGWPYVQHRGGPKGFLKVIDDHTLAFADFRGNKQYITTGNLFSDDRVALIFVDYPRQARLKLLGHAKIFEGKDADVWLPRVQVAGYKAVIERVYVIQIEAYDWNCPQHIVPRYTAEEIRDGMKDFEKHVEALEQENEALRKELAGLRGLAPSTAGRAERRYWKEENMTSRPPLPPFTEQTAVKKVRLAEDGWNSRDPEKVSLAYTVDSRWRNRAEFVNGREQIVDFLARKWARELDYRLIKELWAFHGNRIAVRFAYEYRDDSGNWFRAYGNENWEFDQEGLMYARHASINDLPIVESDRKFHWPPGRRPDEHRGLSDLGL